MPPNHLILCRPLLLLPSIFPSIGVFSRPKYWSFSFSISPSKEHSGLISFRMDWLDLFAVQETLKSLLQCKKMKSESEVAQSCPTLSDPMDDWKTSPRGAWKSIEKKLFYEMWMRKQFLISITTAISPQVNRLTSAPLFVLYITIKGSSLFLCSYLLFFPHFHPHYSLILPHI